MDSEYICDVLLNGRLVFSIGGVTEMTRGEILDKAKEIVTHDRNNQYGEPERNFKVIADFWTIYTGVAIDEVDVACMMILFKMGRNGTGKHKSDNYIDICGYAACGGEIATRWEELEG